MMNLLNLFASVLTAHVASNDFCRNTFSGSAAILAARFYFCASRMLAFPGMTFPEAAFPGVHIYLEPSLGHYIGGLLLG
jgi:hypothetical protein